MSDEGYVNEGTDRRLRGPLGSLAAWVQRQNSFKSPHPPRLASFTARGRWRTWEYRSVPGDKPFTVQFYTRDDGTIDTYRWGHRYDAHWGDEKVQGYNPDPHIVGGYIYDVIIKLRRSPEEAATYLYER